MKGVLWYQGESYAPVADDEWHYDPAQQQALFQFLMQDWRHGFGQVELPFLFVQLPSLNRDWASYRQLQLAAAQADPHSHMAVTIDTGHPTNVHPKDKKPVGERLARLAFAEVYHQPELVASGPLATRARVDASGVVIEFEYSGTGLKARGDVALNGFELRHPDGRWSKSPARPFHHTVWMVPPKGFRPTAVRSMRIRANNACICSARKTVKVRRWSGTRQMKSAPTASSAFKRNVGPNASPSRSGSTPKERGACGTRCSTATKRSWSDAFLSEVKFLQPFATKALRFRCVSPSNTGILIDDLSTAKPEPMRVTSVRVRQALNPVLIGKRNNPVHHLEIETEGRLLPPTVQAVTTRIGGTVKPTEGGAIELRSGRTLLASVVPAKDGSATLEPGSVWPLKAGTSALQLCVVLKENADWEQRVDLSDTRLQLLAAGFNGLTTHTPVDPAGDNRIGIALRIAGQEGVHTYRIPGIATTPKGTLVAAYDLRHRVGGDLPGDIDVAIQTSSNQGRTLVTDSSSSDQGRTLVTDSSDQGRTLVADEDRHGHGPDGAGRRQAWDPRWRRPVVTGTGLGSVVAPASNQKRRVSSCW